LLSKYKALINITESSSSANTRKKNALIAIENEIKALGTINTDYSTLKKTDIVNTIKTIISYGDAPPSCKDLAKSILKRWKESMKADMKDSRIKKLRGGKLIDIPSDVQNTPTNISPVLWNKFCANFNESQLFAIKYIIDDSNSNQDTKISLIQGPPGLLRLNSSFIPNLFNNNDYRDWKNVDYYRIGNSFACYIMQTCIDSSAFKRSCR
jgi:hypothetical protein